MKAQATLLHRPLFTLSLSLAACLFATTIAFGFAGGDGSPGNPYQVATAAHLDAVRNHLEAHFVQIADIDLGVAPWNEGDGWEPIDAFGGIYDGNGYAIRDIRHAFGVEYLGGLFGEVLSEGVLRNIHMDGGIIAGRWWNAAGLASHNRGLIENCHVSTTITYAYELAGGVVVENSGLIRDSVFSGSVSGGHWVGGIAAMNSGLIEHSQFTGSAFAAYHSVGGVVGGNGQNWTENETGEGIIRQSSSSGSVAARQDMEGYTNFSYSAGGLAGDNLGLIEQCYSSASVDGRGPDDYPSGGTGGLVGSNGGVIRDSFAEGTVIGQNEVGALVGKNFVARNWDTDEPIFAGAGTIERAYATGSVTGLADVGGLVGLNEGDVLTSYWGTTEQMRQRSLYLDAGWQIAAAGVWAGQTWWIDDGNGYPQLGAITPPFAFEVGDDDTVVVTTFAAEGGAVIIPASIGGRAVSGIGADAFRGKAVSSVQVAAGITNISSGAFADCTNLVAVMFHGNAPLASGSAPLNDGDAMVQEGGIGIFDGSLGVTVYRRFGTEGWTDTFAGAPTRIWPEFIALTEGTDSVVFEIATSEGQVLVVEARDSLAEGEWQEESTYTWESGTLELSYPEGATQRLFYRIRIGDAP